jgi:hypothetical protein
MNFSTENLTPPSLSANERSLSEAEYARRQAEIARCLGKFREEWDAFLPKEPVPLANVIPINVVAEPALLEHSTANYLSFTG